MQIINTYRCNFKCEHCLWSCGPSNRGYMDKTTYLECHKVFGDSVVNLLGGEPFLHPDIMWQIEFASWRNLENFRIPTNGSWILTPEGKPSKKLLALADSCLEFKDDTFWMYISNDQFHRPFMRHPIEKLENAIRHHCPSIRAHC